MRDVARCGDPKEACLQLLRLYDSSSAEWQLGKTRVRNTLPLHLYYVFQCLKCSFICSHRLRLFMCVFVICCFVLVGVPKGESGAAIGKEAGGRSASGCSHYSGLSAGLQSKVNTSSYINTQIPVSEYIYSVYDMFCQISHTDRWQIKMKSGSNWHHTETGHCKDTQKLYWYHSDETFLSRQSSHSQGTSHTEGFNECENDANHMLFPLNCHPSVAASEVQSCTCFLFAACRRQYKRLLQSVLVIQKNWRALFWRRRFLMLRWASITLQKRVRGQRARQLYAQMLEERKRRMEEERRQREEEERER